jgi:molecular chaperone GrpE (heat shock protein)
MNTNLSNIVIQIITEYGESILADHRRLTAFFSDLAKDEPKPLRTAFVHCIEADAHTALKDAPDAAERVERKAAIAQRLRDEHGLDITLCGEALDILEAALSEEKKETTIQIENTTEGQTRDSEFLSEEISNLQKIIAEKNDQLIRCAQNIEHLTEEKKQRKKEKQQIIAEKDDQLTQYVQNIERLTEEKKQSEDEKQQIKDGRTAAVVLGIIAVAISIGVGVSKYNEMYYSLQYDYNELSRDYAKSKTLWAIKVTKLEVGNCDQYNKWITKPGEKLTSAAMRFFNPVITVDSLIRGEITFFIKIISPSGVLRRNEKTSPEGYSTSKTTQVSQGKNQYIDLDGWGNAERGTYSAGEWTVEVWYNEVCLRSEKVRIN